MINLYTNQDDSILTYFAGHGLTLDNEPYILPIDAYPNNAKTCIPMKDLLCLEQNELELIKH